MQRSNLLRYGLWLAVAATAAANRREYHMSTTWLPHLVTNSLSLLLPDLYRVVAPDNVQNTTDPHNKNVLLPEDLTKPLDILLKEDPQYAGYVMPLALGYILSHPRFNIYKGKMGELRLAGLGLDAIPHSAAQPWRFTALVCDTVDAAAETLPTNSPLAPIAQWSDQHKALFSAAVLVLATTDLGSGRIFHVSPRKWNCAATSPRLICSGVYTIR